MKEFVLNVGIGAERNVEVDEPSLVNILLAGLGFELPKPFTVIYAPIKAQEFGDTTARVNIVQGYFFFIEKDGMCSDVFDIEIFLEENYSLIMDFIGDRYKAEKWMFSELWASNVGCAECYELGKMADCWGKETCHGYYNGCGCKYCVEEQNKEGGQNELCNCLG